MPEDEDFKAPEVVQYEETGITEAEFINKESDYYVNIFRGFREKNTKAYWNWAAFFFTAYWCFYRKIYNVGMAIIGISLLIRFAGGSLILSLALNVVIAIFGNYFYMRHVDEEMARIRQMPLSEQREYAKREGGTSVGAVFLLLFIMIVLGIFIYIFKRPLRFRY